LIALCDDSVPAENKQDKLGTSVTLPM